MTYQQFGVSKRRRIKRNAASCRCIGLSNILAPGVCHTPPRFMTLLNDPPMSRARPYGRELLFSHLHEVTRDRKSNPGSTRRAEERLLRLLLILSRMAQAIFFGASFVAKLAEGTIAVSCGITLGAEIGKQYRPMPIV